MLDGAMLMWWILTIPSLLFVLIDIFRTTPEATVMKWAFVILTAFTGPVGAFFYVLGCREPLKGTHAQYVSVRWRQVLGSTMHCAAGDGIGIVVGAAIAAGLALSFWPDFLLEYVLGFGFGWPFFQAFAMRDMAGGDYRKSLRMTFLPEFLSMNVLMSGMLLVSKFWMPHVPGADSPGNPQFWFIMSMALLAGFIAAYPMNWWMVANHMKHGMITTTSKAESESDVTAASLPNEATMQMHDMGEMHDMASMATEHMDGHGATASHTREMARETPTGDMSGMEMPAASRSLKLAMVTVSLSVLVVTLAITSLFA